jgi:hypothetical protein
MDLAKRRVQLLSLGFDPSLPNSLNLVRIHAKAIFRQECSEGLLADLSLWALGTWIQGRIKKLLHSLLIKRMRGAETGPCRGQILLRVVPSGKAATPHRLGGG